MSAAQNVARGDRFRYVGALSTDSDFTIRPGDACVVGLEVAGVAAWGKRWEMFGPEHRSGVVYETDLRTPSEWEASP